MCVSVSVLVYCILLYIVLCSRSGVQSPACSHLRAEAAAKAINNGMTVLSWQFTETSAWLDGSCT